jgi:hypothetical protein
MAKTTIGYCVNTGKSEVVPKVVRLLTTKTKPRQIDASSIPVLQRAVLLAFPNSAVPLAQITCLIFGDIASPSGKPRLCFTSVVVRLTIGPCF